MSGIFISYRRDDCGGYALNLYRVLRKKFGPKHAFRDIDTVPPGRDFVKVIEETLSSCKVLIALMGKQWLSMTKKLLNAPQDFTRLENVSRMYGAAQHADKLTGAAGARQLIGRTLAAVQNTGAPMLKVLIKQDGPEVGGEMEP